MTIVQTILSQIDNLTEEEENQVSSRIRENQSHRYTEQKYHEFTQLEKEGKDIPHMMHGEQGEGFIHASFKWVVDNSCDSGLEDIYWTVYGDRYWKTFNLDKTTGEVKESNVRCAEWNPRDNELAIYDFLDMYMTEIRGGERIAIGLTFTKVQSGLNGKKNTQRKRVC